jgi:hypothetical protein
LRHPFQGATLLLVGGTDVVSAPATLPRFVEDMTRQEREAELRRFMEIRHTLSDEERIHVQTFISSIPGLVRNVMPMPHGRVSSLCIISIPPFHSAWAA